MKKIIISLVFALIAYFDLSACEYTLECWDAWGDGWNGGYMEVYINGSYQGDAYADGIGTIWTITANQGDLLEFYYVSGSYEDENEWYLYNSSGTLIAGDGPYPNTGWVLWHTVNCGSIAPSIAGDCSDALNVCTDLGFQIDANGYGSINEIPPLGSLGNPLNNNPGGSGNEGCLQIGESNSTWMIVNIAGDGNLEFNFGGSSQSGYYDWIMYPYDENSCTNIPANLVAPVRCNWNAVSYGGTGLAATTPPGGNSGNFEPPLPVVCGEQYIICFSNYSSAVTNVPLQFSGSASVACLPLSCAGTSSCNSSPGDPIYQDCMNAIPVCQDYFCQESSYSGSGSIQNEINPASSCLSGGELNDVWYIFTILQSGNLHFEITPNDLADDYDWALYNLTDASCGDIYTNPSLEESCNYSSTPGVTGADGSSTFNSQPASGSPGNAALPVYAGETYVLNISNYSSSQSGYELDFSQSTATIFDNVPPSLSTNISAPTCGANQITFQFSENVLCSTVQNCDFSITGPGGPYALSGVAGLSCSSGGMQEDVFSININPPVTVNGSYNLNLVPGCGFVEDLCGNVATAGSLSFTITALTSSATSSQINCFGSCNGDATVTASNGTPPYDYYWEDNNGTIVSNINNSSAVQNTVTNLCAGVYSVTITDNLGCSSQSTTSISEPPQLSITLTSTAESCGASDGTITAVVSGGTGLYDFNILPNGNNIYNQNSPYTFTNLNAGSYSVTVTDENNCTASGNISINSGGNVTAGFTYSGNQCYTPGNNIISFTSASTGGTNYSWDFNGDGYVDNNTTNPSWLFTTPGSYNVSLTVTNGQCSDIETINVLIYDGITLISSFSNSTCGVSNGSASVSVVNGTSGYFYDWMPNGFTGDGTSTYSNLPPGNYLVTVTDINSCTASTNIIVGNQDGMNVSVSSTDVSCSGVANGTVTVSISNGTPVYSYSWLQGTNSDSNTTGSNVFSLTGLNTGTIYITVTDANNCSYFGSAIINQAENLSLTANVNNISCYGNSDGMAWVSIINGIPPFNYLWLNSAGDIISTQEYALNMPAGIFGLTITDSTGCTSSQTIILNNPEPVTVTVTGIPDTICPGQQSVISAIGNGGVPPYTFTWSDAPEIVDSVQFQLVSPLTTTIYFVSVTDGNNCQSQPTGVQVMVMSTFNIEIIAEDTVICQGESTKLTAFCTSSQYGTQYYMWNTGEITSEISVMPDNNSSYVVVAADNCLIPDTAVIYIDVLPAPVIDIRADRINGCAPVLVKFSNIHQDNMIYEWNFDDIPSGQNNTSQLQNPEHLFENSGNYDITLSVTSLENDCQNKHTFNNYIRVFANPEADFIISSEVTSLFDAEVSFFDLSADNVTFWSWSFGDGGYSYYQNPSHIYKTADTFTVNLVVSTSEYCHDTLSKTVIIKPEHTLYWPTAFLPKPGDANDDNAYFTPIGTNVGDCDDCYKLYIYDRWGQKVFETKEFYGNNPSDNNRWNGRYYNKGQMVPVGVYTWYIEYKDVNNISHHNTGAITIIR